MNIEKLLKKMADPPKPIKIRATVRLLKTTMYREDWLQFSWLKNKKKLLRKKRLWKKFIKHIYKYLPSDIQQEYMHYGSPLLVDAYEKAKKQIMEEEDKQILSFLREGGTTCS